MDGLVQERRNSSALAMEFRLSCTNPLTSKSHIAIFNHDIIIMDSLYSDACAFH